MKADEKARSPLNHRVEVHLQLNRVVKSNNLWTREHLCNHTHVGQILGYFCYMLDHICGPSIQPTFPFVWVDGLP